MSVFVLENVSKSFYSNKKENKVLESINLKFPDVGLISIVGKSGCGKSTLLNILMGIEKPTSGKVKFLNKDISKFSDKKFSSCHLNGVSLIFQHYNLFNNFTAFENVILPLEMKGIKRREITRKAKEYFKSFNIEHLLSRKVKNLSGGEKQRIAIIRSLITEPKVLLCDEPTGALDTQNSREIMGILRKISQKTLVIMVSHNKNLVNEFSDFILVLKDGKIVSNNMTNLNGNSNQKLNLNIKYSSRWKTRFIKKNFIKNFKKNLFSIIACTLSFTAMFISVGFSEGSKSSQEEALEQNLSLGFATISESQFVEIEGSPLNYEKTVRPSLEVVDKHLSDFNSIRIEENLSYFISSYPSCEYRNRTITNFSMVPLYDVSLETYGKDLLKSGKPPQKNFNEIIVNEEFATLFDESILNRTITLNNNASVTYQTGDKDNPFIKDNLNLIQKFKVVGIVHEFSFLNTPKIYYSYAGAKNFLKGQMMENLSFFFGHKYTYYDYLESCENDDPVSSYSSFLFVTDPNEVEKFFSKVKEINGNGLSITSTALETKETYGTFIGSFTSTLIVFVLIAFAGINFILGMISLSTFLENRKDTAILTCLGARNGSIYSMYLIENIIVILLSFIASIFAAKIFQNILNNFIYKKFMLSNLIMVPFKSYFNIPFGLIIFLLFIAVICSTLFTLTPMFIYRHKSLTDELRDE